MLFSKKSKVERLQKSIRTTEKKLLAKKEKLAIAKREAEFHPPISKASLDAEASEPRNEKGFCFWKKQPSKPSETGIKEVSLNKRERFLLNSEGAAESAESNAINLFQLAFMLTVVWGVGIFMGLFDGANLLEKLMIALVALLFIVLPLSRGLSISARLNKVKRFKEHVDTQNKLKASLKKGILRGASRWREGTNLQSDTLQRNFELERPHDLSEDRKL